MKVLYVAPRLPHPVLDREHVRSYQQIRALSREHDVDVIALGTPGASAEALAALRPFCGSVEVVEAADHPVAPATARHALATRSLAERRGSSRALVSRLAAHAASGEYDLVFVYSTAMAPYGRLFAATPRVVDLVEVSSARWEEHAARRRFPVSTVFRRESQRLAAIERSAARDFDVVLVASASEATALRERCGPDVRVASIPTAAPPHAPPTEPPSGMPTILLPGNLDHLPNAEAAVRFARDVFPEIRKRVPDATLRIVGRGVGRGGSTEVADLAREPGIVVDDGTRAPLREHYSDAWVVVAPHAVVRGVRNEILEALAMAVPTVATSAAYEGLTLPIGSAVEVAAAPATLVERLCDLLADERRRMLLGLRGRRALLEHHDHDAVAEHLHAALDAAAAAAAARAAARTIPA